MAMLKPYPLYMGHLPS